MSYCYLLLEIQYARTIARLMITKTVKSFQEVLMKSSLERFEVKTCSEGSNSLLSGERVDFKLVERPVRSM